MKYIIKTLQAIMNSLLPSNLFYEKEYITLINKKNTFF
jgi:hypothetical protein